MGYSPVYFQGYRILVAPPMRVSITTPQNNKGLITKHHTSLRKIKQWIRKFDQNRVHFIQYAVISTSFNILKKSIRATSYTLSKGLGRDKLALSCTYSSSSLMKNLKLFLLILLVFLLCICTDVYYR